MRILVLPGDGIGPEITAATIHVLRAAAQSHQLKLEIVEDVVGHASLERYGTTVRPDLLDKVRAADGLILGPTATIEFREPGEGADQSLVVFPQEPRSLRQHPAGADL